MGFQKKTGKGRIDKWYRLAKEKGYRARAAFKLVQLNRKYGFLQKSRVVLDLCAAPGSWCQVAAETLPSKNSLIIGVDLAPIKPIPKVISFQADITSDACRSTIRQHLKTLKADTVLHDGAPNVGVAWVQDAYSQAALTLQALKLATEFLILGGTFVTKVFRSKDSNSLLWIFNQLFTKVEATKPPSSRNVSAEIFVVCLGYKAPKKIDPRLLDAKSVFADLKPTAPNHEARVFNPEKKKRKRDGYDEGDWTQFKVISAMDFIKTLDPISILGTYNQLIFESSGVDSIPLATLARLPETSQDVLLSCSDLKVLGRKEFKALLRWRIKAREIFGMNTSSQELNEDEDVVVIDEELTIDEEMKAFDQKDQAQKKRDRRKANEKKQKDILRMQMSMITPTDIGLEQSGPDGPDVMFQIAHPEQPDQEYDFSLVTAAARAKSSLPADPANFLLHSRDDDSDGDRLETELDGLYQAYQERKLVKDNKSLAMRRYEEDDGAEFNGISDNEDSRSDDSFELESQSSSDEHEDQKSAVCSSITAQNSRLPNTTSSRADIFFDQEIFASIHHAENFSTTTSTMPAPSAKAVDTVRSAESSVYTAHQDSDHQLLGSDRNQIDEHVLEENEMRSDKLPLNSNSRAEIDIITAEAMSLAHNLATGVQSTQELVDDGFNKYTFRDTDGLPEWFLVDEQRHSKPHKPMTAAGAAAIKEKLRAFNARPMKKVIEAKERKKLRAARKLEKLRKKSALMAEEEGISEREKATNIVKLMSRAGRKKPKQNTQMVVARGSNRAIHGRPRGVKGRYKIVDARLKKDVRADKRIAKRKK